ncbi:MAG: ATP-binding cassette domain-containing protein [Deltaproteobacteria bacterium]|nr:ATP-binding cassette domain-containing protein [Deltaproteobacteria bacterium]
MISIENLTKSFGGQLLFDSASFRLNSRERIGLVGRNGHGKTTLFRMIINEETYDTGAITIPGNYRIGCVRQRLTFTEDTVLKEGIKGLNESEKDSHWKVEKILAGLGFSENNMHQHPNEFSGGFQVRLNLAKVLVSEPDLLLLDEPTNYLDITSIRWIQRFLVNWPHELMLVTHNRSFMDKVVTHILGIHRKKIRKIAGNTEKYYAQIAQDEEIYEKTRLNDERRQKEIKQFINRFRAKARLANLVQSRIKTLEKTEKKKKLETIKTLDFSFRSNTFRGKHVLNARNVTFSYDQKEPLIQGFDILLEAGDRVGIIGKNGKGKTTLLKLLSGVLASQAGEISYNPTVKKGFFEQTNISSLVNTRTVEEEILYSHTDVDRQLARNICGAMMFEGDAALKKISVLSGGEKSRVMLGKLLVTPLNLLLLDEPTNHLDMDACDAMLAAIDSFDGTVIIVTHDEMFLHALANRLIVFKNNRTFMFEGSYQQFLEKCGWEDEEIEEKSSRKNTGDEKSEAKLTKKELRRQRSEIITKRSKLIRPVEKKIVRAEGDIELNEKKLDNLNVAILKASGAGDGKKIAEISRSIHHCQTVIDQCFDELENLYKEKEKLELEFNE